MTEEQIKEESLKIYNQRIQDEAIQKYADELYDAGSKVKIIDESVKSLEFKLDKAKQQQELLIMVFNKFIGNRDYAQFCKEYTRITNS